MAKKSPPVTTTIQHLRDCGLMPLSHSMVVRISFLANQAHLLRHGQRPNLAWVRIGGARYKMAVFDVEDADLIVGAAHCVLASSYQQSGNHQHGQWASDTQSLAPVGCQCQFCQLARPVPPQTLPTTMPRVTLAVPLDDLQASMNIKFKARGHRVFYGEVTHVGPAGRGRGLWITVLCDGGQVVKVRSTSLRELERV